MKKKYYFFLLGLLTISLFYNCDNQTHKDSNKKERAIGDTITNTNLELTKNVQQSDFIGEQLPSEEPIIFAPGLISTPKVDESTFEISSAGNEIQFFRSEKIYMMSKTDTGWTNPSIAPFSGKHVDGESSFSPDGKKIYFMSNRLATNSESLFNTWVSEKVNDIWETPINLKLPSFNKTIHAVTVAKSGNIYFSGLNKITYNKGEYQSIESLEPAIKGFHPFIAPDESYLIFDRYSNRNSDLFIIYSKPDGTWTQPIKLNNKINTPALESNAFVTPDGRFMFFTRKFDIFWVDADFIEELRPEF